MNIILAKEIKTYLRSGYGTIFMTIYLFIFGLYFIFMNIYPTPNSVISATINNMIFIFILLFPMITMKSFAEEKNNKTDQLLFTSPISLPNIILGKYIAAFILLLATLSVTFLHVLIINFFTENLGLNTILTSYLGFLLICSAFIAIGIFISAISQNQIIAGISSLGISIILFITSSISDVIPRDSLSGLIFAIVCIVGACLGLYWLLKNIWISLISSILLISVAIWTYVKNITFFEGIIQKTIKVLSITKYSNDYFIGIISLSSIVYYLSIVFLFLFFTYVLLDKKRWS